MKTSFTEYVVINPNITINTIGNSIITNKKANIKNTP